ncbi:MAG: orotate phosphoribosyltransferase [Bacteroidia bacterium]
MEVETLLAQLIHKRYLRIEDKASYTWQSGIQSPIYYDGRALLGDVRLRELFVEKLIALRRAHFPTSEGIVSVATGGIPWGAWMAQKENMPLAYVRPAAKEYGLRQAVEGALPPHTTVFLIEDTLSTGKSLMHAYQHAQSYPLLPQGALCLWDYGFHRLPFKVESVLFFPQLFPFLERLLSQSVYDSLRAWYFTIQEGKQAT